MKFIKQFLYTKVVTSFLKHKINNIQLDCYNKKGEIVFQVYKGYDVMNWEQEINTCDNCSVIEILFHSNKTNNSENNNRFLNSKLSEKFNKVDFHKQNTYFYSLKNDEEVQLNEFLKVILAEIYNLTIYDVKCKLSLYKI